MTAEQQALRAKIGTLTPKEYQTLARRLEVEHWQSINQFCGRCGAPMRPHANPNELAKVCSACGHTAYPALTPAVIVLVTKGERILLQRNTHYGIPNWTLVAGFLEPGETLEDAVVREVREEASIELRDIRYFASQPWPFPSTLMVAFQAEWAGGELTPDGEEIIQSGWFERDHLPELPLRGSIARTLIDTWLARA